MSKLIRLKRNIHYGRFGLDLKLNPEIDKIFAEKKVIHWRFRMEWLYIEYEENKMPSEEKIG